MANEKRLISLDEAIAKVKDDGILGEGYSDDERIDDVCDILESCEIVDAVEVVRCKDCKRWKPGDSFSGDSLDDMQRIGRCPIMRFGRRENDFCCEGERRTDDSRT